MLKTFMLIKSKLEDGEVKNQVIGQVNGATKAYHVVSKKFAEAGLIEDSAEGDELGVTKIGVDPWSDEKVAFSSVFKSGL